MTYAYDLERVRVALADAVKAADALAAHSVPDWVAHRIATFKAKVQAAGNKLYDLAVEWMDELRPRGKAGDEEK